MISLTETALKTCSSCGLKKLASEFSWNDTTHKYQDSRCRSCNTIRSAKRRKPRNSRKPYTHRSYLQPDMYSYVPADDIKFIATLIDGEGCITSSFPVSSRKPLSVKISMIHKPTMQWLHEMFGGSLCPHRTRQTNARQSWSWYISGIRSLALLCMTLPYMRVKQEEAEIAIALGVSLWSDENVRGHIPEDILMLRRALGQELRDLKRREWPI